MLAALLAGTNLAEQQTAGVPVRKVAFGRIIYRFHDTSPISPGAATAGM